MNSDQNQEEFQPKPRNEYNPTAKSVLEYSYYEDGNYYYRDAMEDGNQSTLKISYLKDHFLKDNLLGDYRSGLFGILDGHGGFKVSRFCTKSIPEVAIKKTN